MKSSYDVPDSIQTNKCAYKTSTYTLVTQFCRCEMKIITTYFIQSKYNTNLKSTSRVKRYNMYKPIRLPKNGNTFSKKERQIRKTENI